MSSLVLILALFLRKRKSSVERMRLTSRQMRRMRQNVIILAIQSQNNIHELLFARNPGIDSACRRGETGKAMDEGSKHPTRPEEL